MKIITKLVLSLFLAVGVLSPIGLAGQASAQNAAEEGSSSSDSGGLQGSLCSGAELELKEDGDCKDAADAGTEGVNNLVKRGLDIFSWIVGVISVVMIMVGGVKYITSQGSPENVTSAKNTILYAAIGLVVVALAQVIVRFVLNSAITTQTT